MIQAIVMMLCVSARAFDLDAQPATNPSAAQPPDSRMLSEAESVHVKAFRFTGNTVFPNWKLSAELQNYIDRDLTIEDLEEARLKLTNLYVTNNYINSGAVLPDQDVVDGIITFQIIEGRLDRRDIHIKAPAKRNKNGEMVSPRLWLSPEQYIRPRIEAAAGRVLNLDRLRNRLELLRENPNIERINAELKPGATPGTSELDLFVEERNPFHLALDFSNRRPPSIGAERLEAQISCDNLTRISDSLDIRYTILKGQFDDLELSGSDEYSINYSRPLNSSDTTVSFGFSRSDSLEIEETFADLNITSQTNQGYLSIRQPLFRTVNRELAFFVTGSVSENKSFLLGQPFSFSPGARDGTSQVTALRFGPEFFTRNQSAALSLRSTFSFGLDLFGSTENGDDLPDSHFFTWLGQAQYVRRLTSNDVVLLLRGNIQLTPDPLLSLEQFAVGGFDTVRGYRENQLVRDNGFACTLELHVPILTTSNWSVQLAPFFDIGGSWNHSGPTDTETISSIGIGLLVTLKDHVDLAIYYGYPFTDFGSTDDLQDISIHFDLRVALF